MRNSASGSDGYFNVRNSVSGSEEYFNLRNSVSGSEGHFNLRNSISSYQFPFEHTTIQSIILIFLYATSSAKPIKTFTCLFKDYIYDRRSVSSSCGDFRLHFNAV